MENSRNFKENEVDIDLEGKIQRKTLRENENEKFPLPPVKRRKRLRVIAFEF